MIAVLFFCIPKSSRKVCAAEEGPCVCLHREEGQEEEVWPLFGDLLLQAAWKHCSWRGNCSTEGVHLHST